MEPLLREGDADPLVLTVEIGVAGEGNHGTEGEGTTRSEESAGGIALLSEQGQTPDGRCQQGTEPTCAAAAALQA